MRIEASADLTAAIVPYTGTQTTVVGARRAEIAAANQQRNKRRRFADLNRENYRDIKLEIPPAYLRGGAKAGKTVASRRILASRKTHSNHLDDDPLSTQKFLEVAAAPSLYPHVPKCSICGFISTVICIRCGARYCSLKCGNIHSETRCQR